MSGKIFLEKPVINNLEGRSIQCILHKTKIGRLQQCMEKGLVSCTGSGEEKHLDLEADVGSVCTG